MTTFKPDYDAPTDPGKHIAQPLALGPNDRRVSCPRCGSPYVATTDPSDPVAPDTAVEVRPAVENVSQALVVKLRQPLAGFSCVAPTAACGYSGLIAGA